MDTNHPRPMDFMIVSGGQTGVDQAALDVAIHLNLPHGGWCPRDRRCEAGTIPARFQLQESHSRDYAVRTEQNVIDSDATLILYRGRLQGGTALTARLARKHNKPCLRLDLSPRSGELGELIDQLDRWRFESGCRRLNVAGPRESGAPGIYREAFDFLISAFRG